MERNIMVYIETVDNSPVVVSLEALALAKKVSKENNKKVIAVLVGENLDDIAKKCFEYGADEVLYLEENKKELDMKILHKKPFPYLIDIITIKYCFS